jgi:alpha-galactosidase
MKHRAVIEVITVLMATILGLVPAAVSREGDGSSARALASTPPMGWNSWNKFGCNVSEDLIRQMADAMVSSGMKDAGYQYVVIDDCWQVERDSNGNIVADPQRFPSGMKVLAEYVHSRGLKFGLYSDAGTKTCAGRPGSRGYEYQDARLYAAWGVDYLKYDWCNTSTQDARSSYETMRTALNASGREIVFSMCEWGKSQPWLWAKDIGNLWRTTGDIQDRWEGKKEWKPGDCCNYGMLDILDLQVGLESYSGPGHWNDPDMLEVGNGGMTTAEYRAHFSLWAILAAPLIAGNDLRKMPPEICEILTQKEVIAVDQDVAGSQGQRVHKDGNLEVWSKTLHDGSRAVVLLNRGTETVEITAKWPDLGYPTHLSAHVRDLWQKTDLGEHRESFSAKVAPHAVVMVTVRP